MATIRHELCVKSRGSNDMKRYNSGSAVAVLSLSLMAPASAAPPTVTPSPGYDARLQEQRAASSSYQPAAPAPRPVHRRVRRVHDAVH
jgi:hypothetical protein